MLMHEKTCVILILSMRTVTNYFESTSMDQMLFEFQLLALMTFLFSGGGGFEGYYCLFVSEHLCKSKMILTCLRTSK